MSLSQRQQTFVVMVANLILYAQQEGIALTFGEAYRTQYQQDIHRQRGASRVRYSKHQDRLAVDFNIFIDGEWISKPEKVESNIQDMVRKFGEQWEEDGGRWGGRFGVKKENYDTELGWDSGHFEL